MAKRITVTLSDKVETYLIRLMASLQMPHKTIEGELRQANISDCINESLEVLMDFEDKTDDQLVNWLEEKYKIYSKRRSEESAEIDAFAKRQLSLIDKLNN